MSAAAPLRLPGFFSHRPSGGAEMSEWDDGNETVSDLLEYIWQTWIRAVQQPIGLERKNCHAGVATFQLASWRGVSRSSRCRLPSGYRKRKSFKRRTSATVLAPGASATCVEWRQRKCWNDTRCRWETAHTVAHQSDDFLSVFVCGASNRLLSNPQTKYSKNCITTL